MYFTGWRQEVWVERKSLALFFVSLGWRERNVCDDDNDGHLHTQFSSTDSGTFNARRSQPQQQTGSSSYPFSKAHDDDEARTQSGLFAVVCASQTELNRLNVSRGVISFAF